MKIAMLASGGVDSSVALCLLQEQGHDITAFYLKIWLEDELAFLGSCPWEEDQTFLEEICHKRDIPLKVISLQREYWQQVVTYTIDELRHGHTPSPDIMCNQRVKFGSFYEHIDASYAKVASGHYAQIEEKEGICYLKRSPDAVKDQTYFLTKLSQQQLQRILFPIGHLPKKEVRKLAQKFNLPNQNRKDSQGICFLGKISFSDFICHHLKTQKGNIIEIETGKKLGEHNGFWYYTIGQRKGIGLSGGPWYVVDKDIENNIIYISHSNNSLNKARNAFEVINPNWISGKPQKENLMVKIRHGEHLYQCKVKFLEKEILQVQLHQSDQGIATGQFAVFYDEEICLGGGVIQTIGEIKPQ